MDEIIFSYTRKQAIEDGILIDVSALAKEAGFKVPVALTVELYADYIKTELPGQDETGRLWDTLFMLALAAKNTADSILYYCVIYRMDDEKDENVTIKAVIGPGDQGEPVITVMLPHES